VSLANSAHESLWKAVAPELCPDKKSGSVPVQFAGTFGALPGL